jgi:cardiolipin synthase
MLRELKKAKHYIFFEYFIIDDGLFWDSVLEILKQKAKEGVDVRVMYDDVGCLGTVPVHYYKKLQKYGIKAHAFSPFKPFIDIRMNNRDHRKILVIDGHTCFTGGINIADEYINKIVRFGHWKDNAIMIKGEAVYGFTMLFLGNWNANWDPNAEIDARPIAPRST